MSSPGGTSSNVRMAVADALKRFIATENSGARLLAIASLVALVWANSPLASSYSNFWTIPLPDALTLQGHIPDLRHLINDGAMTLFFLVVGIEIKRELVNGELSSLRSAAVPVIAAVGGMVLPAVIYAALNAGTETSRGWGIPIATDIAFAVALLVVLGDRIPSGLKVFLLSLAIVDDIGAIAAIALFYADQIELTWLFAMAAVTTTLIVATRSIVLRWWLIVPAGVFLWISAVFAGVHPTIAGVVLAFTLTIDDTEGTIIEDRLHPLTGLLVIPLFGLANAGVEISLAGFGEALTSPVGAGIVLGLVVGKTIGVSLFSWLAVRTGIGQLPAGMTWGHLVGAAAAAGIGFTVSLFITDLAFEDQALIDNAKLAVFVGSLLSAGIAYPILRTRARPEIEVEARS